MQKVSESYDEYHKRWRRIEQVCNFSITYSPPHAPTTQQAPHRSPQPSADANGPSPWDSSSSLSSLVESFRSVSPAFATGRANTLPSMPRRNKSHSLPNAHAIYQRRQSSNSSQEPNSTSSWQQEDFQSFKTAPRQRNDQSGSRPPSSSSSLSLYSNETDSQAGKSLGFYPSASVPFLRKPSYTEAVSGSVQSLDLLDSDGILFSAPSETANKAPAKRTHSGGDVRSQDRALGAIHEEDVNSGVRAGERRGKILNGVFEEDEGGESDRSSVGSGSEVKLGRRRANTMGPTKGSPKITGKPILLSQSNSSVV